MNEETNVDGYWTLNDAGQFEYCQADTDEVLDTVSFEKARSLAAFFMWNLIESVGD